MNLFNRLTELQSKLGVKFKNPNLLLRALTHRSYLNENRHHSVGDNERLEFMGDAVIELAITRWLYDTFPNESEGYLTEARATLVQTPMISAIAKQLGLLAFVLMSRGESQSGNKKSQAYLLCCVYEAIVGAIYLDNGYEASAAFIERTILTPSPKAMLSCRPRDPKSELQDRTQATDGVTPCYKVLSHSGPDHQKIFEVGVYLGDNLVARGIGQSKREAESRAASAALATV